MGSHQFIEREVPASDGYPLGICHWQVERPRALLAMAGATAVPQRFYRRFAEAAAARGYDVVTVDYRGIGRSAPPTLRGFRMDYLDWARVDFASAIRAVRRPEQKLFVVGHSYGGHTVGLLAEDCRPSAAYFFGTGAGWHGWMPFGERLKVLGLWHVLGPILSRWKGYLPFKMLGMGEDLPIDVYRQWKYWCGFPHYFFDDAKAAGALTGFGQIAAPIVAAVATDDLWALPPSRDAFMRGYARAKWSAYDIDPKSIGLTHLGHMGYFRAEASALWAQVFDFFDAQLDGSLASPAGTPRDA